MMYKYDVTYRQALIYALVEYGYPQTVVADYLGINRSGVSRALRTISLKLKEREGWYDY